MSEQFHVTPISTFHGARLLFCVDCSDMKAVKERVTGKQDAVDVAGDPMTIYWDYIVGECDHVLEDWSH